LPSADGDFGLLSPGWAGRPIAQVTGDAAIVAALVRFESAFAAVTGPKGLGARIAEAGGELDPADVAPRARAGGNPVIPLLEKLRLRLSTDDALALHRGATSQDALDTALVLVAKDAARVIDADATATATSLLDHAARHRDTVMTGRTLTQAATPTTLGLKLAGWAHSVACATGSVRRASAALPVQLGGATGTLAALVARDGAGAGVTALEALAAELGLAVPPAPWHVARGPLTRFADALVELSDALGTIGANVALLARTEIGELDDGAAGGSSTMPHKANPVRAVLLSAAARQAPALAAQLHSATVDERPDGAWHAEWQSFRMLLRTVGGAAATGAELARDLGIHEDRIAANVAAAVDDLLAERAGYADGPATPADYVGDAGLLTDRLIAAARDQLA
jgi:3-carboxy-cis,cis-muconate cycloisomerase